eukprot:TRINITY_DN30980_c0_g1_i1.p2 TRINITY_DN30980_c0_g1~~TRINITY_DN30980_c0_g1_i1.p2  ORF type:complete len:319 (+),score=-29.82 TRINITY_DN30980_c0_g1_i1:60-1016(+)
MQKSNPPTKGEHRTKKEQGEVGKKQMQKLKCRTDYVPRIRQNFSTKVYINDCFASFAITYRTFPYDLRFPQNPNATKKQKYIKSIYAQQTRLFLRLKRKISRKLRFPRTLLSQRFYKLFIDRQKYIYLFYIVLDHVYNQLQQDNRYTVCRYNLYSNTWSEAQNLRYLPIKTPLNFIFVAIPTNTITLQQISSTFTHYVNIFTQKSIFSNILLVFIQDIRVLIVIYVVSHVNTKETKTACKKNPDNTYTNNFSTSYQSKIFTTNSFSTPSYTLKVILPPVILPTVSSALDYYFFVFVLFQIHAFYVNHFFDCSTLWQVI